MNSIPMLSSILGLGFASGVNLYASVLIVGLGIRFGWIHGLPGDLNVLTSPAILTVAGVMYFLEFFADKIPYVSIVWDSVHTVIRPLGGAALALASAAKLSPEMQALAMLAGGSVALGAHSTKMGYRLIAHASPEPVSDSVFSLAEDAGVAGLVLLTYQHPYAALAVVSALILGVALALPVLIRTLAFVFHGLLGRVVSWFPPAPDTHAAPAWVAAHLNEASPRTVRCFARRLPKAPRFQQGYLALSNGRTCFVFRAWLRTRSVELQTAKFQVDRGLVFDVAAAGPVSVYLTKDCSQGAPEMGLALAQGG